MRKYQPILKSLVAMVAAMMLFPVGAQQYDVRVNSGGQFDVHVGNTPNYGYCPYCGDYGPRPWRGPVPHYKSKHYKEYKKWLKEQQKWEKKHHKHHGRHQPSNHNHHHNHHSGHHQGHRR